MDSTNSKLEAPGTALRNNLVRDDAPILALNTSSPSLNGNSPTSAHPISRTAVQELEFFLVPLALRDVLCRTEHFVGPSRHVSF